MLNLMNIVKESLPNESKTKSSTMPQSLAISKHSLVKGTPKAIREWLMLSQEDSFANPSQSQESKKENQTKEICGQPQYNAFVQYNQNTHSWRTFQGSLLSPIPDEYLETWPKQGIMQDGVCWEQTIVDYNIEESDYGYWPTPTASDWLRMGFKKESIIKSMEKGGQMSLVYPLRILDIRAQDFPIIYQVIMGWPHAWTSLKPLGMDRYQSWLKQFGGY